MRTAPATRGERATVFVRRWFARHAELDAEDIALPKDLRNGKLWVRVLDRLAAVPEFRAVFRNAKYNKTASQQEKQKRRVAIVIKNLRRIGVYVPRAARTPQGFAEDASDAVHLAIASECVCRFPGCFVDIPSPATGDDSNAPNDVVVRGSPLSLYGRCRAELGRLRSAWSRVLKLREVLLGRLALYEAADSPVDLDEIYLTGLRKSKLKFETAAHAFGDDMRALLVVCRRLREKCHSGERRMLQAELTVSVESGARTMHRLEEVLEENDRLRAGGSGVSGDGGGGPMSKDEELAALREMGTIPVHGLPWLGQGAMLTEDDAADLSATLTSTASDALRLFRYYAVGSDPRHLRLTVDGWYEICGDDCGVLAKLDAAALTAVFRTVVERPAASASASRAAEATRRKRKFVTGLAERDPYVLIVGQLLEAVGSSTRTLFGHPLGSLKDLFLAMDANFNARLSEAEFNEACRRLDVRITEEQCKHLIEEVRRCDGTEARRVSYRGFVRAMQKHHPDLRDLIDPNDDAEGKEIVFGRLPEGLVPGMIGYVPQPEPPGAETSQQDGRAAVEVSLSPLPGTGRMLEATASAAQFVECLLLLAHTLTPELPLAEALQDAWDECLSQGCPSRVGWNGVRRFLHEAGVSDTLNTRRAALHRVFARRSVPHSPEWTMRSSIGGCTGVGERTLSRDMFFRVCEEWGMVRRGVPPGNINLMFAHATGVWDTEEVRTRENPMTFPQFIVAVAALFLRGGVDPFLDTRKALMQFLDEQLLSQKASTALDVFSASTGDAAKPKASAV